MATNPTLPATELNRVKAPVGQSVIRFDAAIDVAGITVNGEEIAGGSVDTTARAAAAAAQTTADSKAADNAVVKLAGTQTLAGAKTFSVSPAVPTTSSGNNTAAAASTAFVQAALSGVSTGPAAGRVETDAVVLTPGSSTATALDLDRAGHVTGVCGLTLAGRTYAFSNAASDSTHINVPWPSGVPAVLDVNGVTLTEGGNSSFRFQGTVAGNGNAGDLTLVQGVDFTDVYTFRESVWQLDCSTLPDSGTASGTVTSPDGYNVVFFTVNTNGADADFIRSSIADQLGTFGPVTIGNTIVLTSNGASSSQIFGYSGSVSPTITPAGDSFDAGATLSALATVFNGTYGAFGTMSALSETQLHLESFAFGPDAVLSYSLGTGTPVATPGECSASQDADCCTAWATAYNIVNPGTPAAATGTTITVAGGPTFVSAGGPAVWTITPGTVSTIPVLTHSFGSGRLVALEISTLHAENLKLTIGGTDRAFTLAAAGVYDFRDVVAATGGIIGHIRTATDQTIVISATALSDEVEVSAVVRKS